MTDKSGQVGPAAFGDVATHPLVLSAEHLAAELLAPAAADVDRTQVPREHLRGLAGAGLLTPTAPYEIGGGGAPPAVGRAVTEVIAGACGSTWFVATQHATPVRALSASSNRPLQTRWLHGLGSGDVLAGIALAQLRRPGPPAVSGRRVGGGWSVSGDLPWLTGWGLVSLVLLGFRDGADVVFALVPAADQPGFTSGALLPLAAMQAARTVSVRLRDFPVADADVVERLPYDEWAVRDAALTANVTPAVFGLLRSVLTRLRAEGERRDEPATVELAGLLGAQAAQMRVEAYRLIDDVPAGEAMEQRLALRAQALELVTVATSSLVAAGAGGSMALTHPAQRWAREGLFHLIQAQTPSVRAATMRAYAAGR